MKKTRKIVTTSVLTIKLFHCQKAKSCFESAVLVLNPKTLFEYFQR